MILRDDVIALISFFTHFTRERLNGCAWNLVWASCRWRLLLLFNSLQSSIPTWWMLRLVRWDGDNLWWSHYPSCCHCHFLYELIMVPSIVALWTVRAIICQQPYGLFDVTPIGSNVKNTFETFCLEVTQQSTPFQSYHYKEQFPICVVIISATGVA
jgi:hypothetical protein